ARDERERRSELALQDVQIRAAQPDRLDPDDDLTGTGRRVLDALDADLADRLDDRSLHLTAPSDSPWTSLSCAAKPAMSTGSETIVAAAHTLARNRPWLVTKLVRNTGPVWAETPVSTRANSSSFQLKMKQISDVAAMPGAEIGTMILRIWYSSPAPSIDAASRMAGGISARNERIIHTAIGRFIEVERMISRKMLSSMSIFCAIR